MPTPSVGDDIEAFCGRCSEETWHAVMAKMGERVVKVVCKRCGTHHGFRAAGEAPAERKPSNDRSRLFGGRRRKRQQATTAPLPPPDPSKPPRPYAASEAFVPGDRVVHPVFGLGQVGASPGPGKIEVVFQAGAKVLACAKTETIIARPTNAVNAPVGDRPPDGVKGR